MKKIILLSSIFLLIGFSASVLAEKIDSILVQQAIYGNFSSSSTTCDCTKKVQSMCDNKTSCEAPVTDADLCGYDPAPGKAKAVDIVYSCDKQGFEANAAEGSVAKLTCPQGKLNHIHLSH